MPSREAEMLSWEQTGCWQVARGAKARDLALFSKPVPALPVGLTRHRAAQKAFPPLTGTSNQEGSYQEAAQPRPAQRLVCLKHLTLQPCLLRGGLPKGCPVPQEMEAPAGSSPGICPEDVWAVSSPLLSRKKEGAGLWASRMSRALGWQGEEDKSTALHSPATTLQLSCFQPCSPIASTAPSKGFPGPHACLPPPMGVSCSFFADVQLPADHLREISATEEYIVHLGSGSGSQPSLAIK